MQFFFRFLLEGSKESILGLLENKYFIVSDVLYGNCRMQIFSIATKFYDIAVEFTATFIEKIPKEIDL